MTRRRLAIALVAAAVVAVAVGFAVWPSEGHEATAAAARRRIDLRLPRARPRPQPAEPIEDPILASPAFVDGRVEDPTHRRVGSARVVLRGEAGQEVVTTSGPDGGFRFEVPQDGRWFVLAEHPRFTPGGAAGPLVVRNGQGPESLVVVVLGSAAALAVRVVDLRGAGLPGATVSLTGLAEGLETDARGEALWGALRPEERVGVTATCPGYAPATERARLSPGRTTSVVLELSVGRELRGRVLDPGRRLVAGATVRALANPHARSGAAATATTDAAGEFALTDLPDEALSLVAAHPDFADSQPAIAEPGARWVELVLTAPSSVSGWVRGRDGSPAAGASIALAEGGRSEAGTSTDESGAFALTGVSAGEYEIVARLDEDAGRVAITLEAGQDLARVEVRLAGPFAATGTVVTRFTGGPVPGARVRPRLLRGSGGRAPSSVLTDAEGAFVLAGLPLDVAELEIRAPGHRAETVALAPTGQDLDLGEIALEPRVFGGVGMTLSVRDGRVKVLGLFQETPASRAGLQSGDLILEVDGERVDGLDLDDVVGRIRGTEGSGVRMLVQREGEAEPFQIDVTRETIDTDRLERE
ncbi:MAG: carboxypeptidase regulatory-like domain-containing protein [Deltaproteobacteria bacterium]|nr:carboxypeptidase regulatory-like domain-containing protein [Deltaproteobacteria bacterium]